jgi:hypothetical protein
VSMLSITHPLAHALHTCLYNIPTHTCCLTHTHTLPHPKTDTHIACKYTCIHSHIYTCTHSCIQCSQSHRPCSVAILCLQPDKPLPLRCTYVVALSWK